MAFGGAKRADGRGQILPEQRVVVSMDYVLWTMHNASMLVANKFIFMLLRLTPILMFVPCVACIGSSAKSAVHRKTSKLF